MRTLLGGVVWAWVAICAIMVAGASAQQVTGVVDTIGFDGRYRPGTWTPMLVRLQSTGAPTGLYELRVRQYDLDGDQPYYSTRVTLTQGKGEQRFWTYFLPEPIRGGMTGQMSTAAELAQRLRITVHNAAGLEIGQLALGASVPQAIDPVLPSGFAHGRGKRFVVFVRDGGSAPPLGDYGTPDRITGLAEDLDYVIIGPDRLPESSLGYDGIDAIVWLEGDPSQLATGGSRRLEAIREFVTRGGHLVLDTPANWQTLNGFEDLLPVDISGTEQTREIGTAADPSPQGPAREIANEMAFPRRDKDAPGFNPWDRYAKPFTIATAKVRPGSVVDRWAYRVDPAVAGSDDRIPWLARRGVGLGCVTWVGQDLGARELTASANWGWSRVWEQVLGTAATPIYLPGEKDRARYKAASYREMGWSVLDAMNLDKRAATLVGVTILFFIGYWLLAGPGTYFWLRYRKRATASWFVFGAVALGATVVTLGVVRVTLRGAPDVKHVSLVRISSDRNVPATAISRLGIYVPRDGAQAIALVDTDPRAPSTISPFPIHPSLHAKRDGDKYLFPAPITYAVPVPTGDAPGAPRVDVPFRTTMKRLQADWYGLRDERIEGAASLRPSSGGTIAGVLTNRAGVDLRNVYIAFRHRSPDGDVVIDHLIFVNKWPAGDPLDLAKAYTPGGQVTRAMSEISSDGVLPNDRFPVHGTFKDWSTYFGQGLRGNSGGEPVFESNLGNSVPILSLFGRLPPAQNPQDTGGTFNAVRADLYRSGVRDWDASNALLAGNLLIVAQAERVALPVPMTIDGDRVVGDGTTIYQFALPLAPIPDPPATRPTTTQATTRSSK